jgi:nicotinamidase-related amidase
MRRGRVPADHPPGIGEAMRGAACQTDALVLVDVLADFGHADGGALFAAFRAAAAPLGQAVYDAREAGIPVVYANDDFGTWSGSRDAVMREAVRRAPEPEVFNGVAPAETDAFLVKPRYSAFDHTPLDLLLRELGVRRMLLAGTATEMCVAQTAIDAREAGLHATVLVAACASVDDANADVALTYLERVARVRLHRDGAALPPPEQPEAGE